jgi:hypothetical protein
MFQREATLERAASAERTPYTSTIVLRAADSAPSRDDEDALFDGWLASLDADELDLILSKLADRQLGALEPTA